MNQETIQSFEPPSLLMVEKAFSTRMPSVVYTFACVRVYAGWWITGKSAPRYVLTDLEFGNWLHGGSRLAPEPKVYHAKVVYEVVDD